MASKGDDNVKMTPKLQAALIELREATDFQKAMLESMPKRAVRRRQAVEMLASGVQRAVEAVNAAARQDVRR
jgi:hypothetical protein